MNEGVLLSTAHGGLEMWNFELSNCIRRWPNLVQPMEITQIVPLSEERVALISDNKVIFLNTTTSEIMPIPINHRQFVTCNSRCQVITCGDKSLQLLDGQTTLWKTDLLLPTGHALFSLSERILVISAETPDGDQGMYVLDAFSGRILRILCKSAPVLDCQFVSDEECAILLGAASGGSSLHLFDVESGDLLSVIDLPEREVSQIAVCPRKRLLAIDRYDSRLGAELIQVHLPRNKEIRKCIR